MRTTHQQGVRLFCSFDLVGSTAIKSRQARFDPTDQAQLLDYSGYNRHWMHIFIAFFREVPLKVEHVLRDEQEKYDFPPVDLEVWRFTGDEILFVSSRLESSKQISIVCRVIYSVLHDLDARYQAQYSLGVKAVVWAAGFPIRNTELRVTPKVPPYVSTNSPFFKYRDNENLETSMTERMTEAQGTKEFLGPEIDLGFRLAANAQPRRLLVSLDIAAMLTDNIRYRPLAPRFFLVGWAPLKGLYRDVPYPIIWIDYEKTKPVKRTSYEDFTSVFAERYFRGDAERNAEEIIDLADGYLRDTSDTRINMYISTDGDKFEPTHIGHYKSISDEDKK